MKDCLIIGPDTAMGYKDIYPLLKDRVLKIGIYAVGWELGYTRVWSSWFTTLTPNRPEKKKLILKKTYNENDYPRYDNYDVIESKSKDIPVDYYDLISVPITFFKYYDYLPYEIVDFRTGLILNGKKMFQRLIIRRKQD